MGVTFGAQDFFLFFKTNFLVEAVVYKECSHFEYPAPYISTKRTHPWNSTQI